VYRIILTAPLFAEPTPASDTDCEEQCIALAHKIEEYLSAVGDAYDNNPEQKSVMLLTVMDLWVSMERCAIKLYGLLRDYDPIFPEDVLDVLQLSRPEDMRRLQIVRSYLHERLTKCGRLTSKLLHRTHHVTGFDLLRLPTFSSGAQS
jgi:hypothetical protein